jgi:antibiotic biosynthesis monooxygenase (ABM) superfamily enzyme
MIWLAVLPTLTGINLLLGGSLEGLSTVPRTVIVATLAVPIVIYGLMPRLHRLRRYLIGRRRRDWESPS